METEKLLCSLGIDALNAELNPICHFLALLGAHHIIHVGRIRVNTVFTAIPESLPTKVVNFIVLCIFVCKCVLYYGHQVSTQLQLTNISIPVAVNTVLRLLMMDSKSVRNI